MRCVSFSVRHLNVVSFAIAVAALSGCQMKRNLDDMHQATVAMPSKLDGMMETTCTMYRSMRQGSSKLSRDQDFEDIVRAPDVAGRLAEAAEYMQGFEYQVWSDVCEGELPREIVMEQAVKELLAKLQGFAGNRGDVSAIHSSKSMQVVYALASTLHYRNALQSSLLKGTGEVEMRPLDLLVEGLMIDRNRSMGRYSGASVPAWAEIVGKYQKDAIYLLRLRQNFLMAYAYSLSDSDKFGTAPGTFAKLRRLLMTDLFNRPWAPNLSERSPTEIDERITAALNYSAETTEALVSLGVDPMFDSKIAELWQRADFSKINVAQLTKSPVAKDRIFAGAVERLITARDRVVSGWLATQHQ